MCILEWQTSVSLFAALPGNPAREQTIRHRNDPGQPFPGCRALILTVGAVANLPPDEPNAWFSRRHQVLVGHLLEMGCPFSQQQLWSVRRARGTPVFPEAR